MANPDPNNPRSNSIFIYTLEHGESKQDQILVLNPTDEEQTITLGSVDGVVTNTGDYTCRQAAEPVEGSGGWVRLSKTELVLPPGGEEKVDFTVSVPESADVGEHNSCLTIQALDEDAEEVSAGVRLRTRQAIRMIITIPGDLRRELSIANFTVNTEGDEEIYTLTAANNGNVSADIDMRVRVSSIFGKEVANVGGEYPLVPGESLTKQFKTSVRPLFGGWYDATPSLRYDKRLGAFGTKSPGAEFETIVGEPIRIFFWPTTAGWILIGTAILAVLAFLWNMTGKVKRRRQLRSSAEPYRVQKDDTIQSLAKRSRISWQELAALNNIKAPYVLVAGQEIMLPMHGVGRGKREALHKK